MMLTDCDARHIDAHRLLSDEVLDHVVRTHCRFRRDVDLAVERARIAAVLRTACEALKLLERPAGSK